ncbi:hypothetical protein [Enterobacter hormaechei]|uniref:hypothetical protein n=1 Tax=Enterobacter hormaechei TaxID=158836 RepID=UPI001F4B64A8|nr:hypothetical protein [Enterobacter hormaechei]HCR2220527.1 hypothetical protein [Enterobacter hormaechei subsp. steigerwaltii]
MELSKQFTKEQLIELAQDDTAAISSALQLNMSDEANELLQKSLAIHEIALAALTAPNDVPRNVLDGICDLSDGGVNAQAICELCKAAVMGGAQ